MAGISCVAKGALAKRLLFTFLFLVGILSLAFGWFCLTTNSKAVAVRNVLQFKLIQRLGGLEVRDSAPGGIVSGMVRDAKGALVPGATVLVASRLGDTYTAETDSDGAFRILDVPEGHYVPVVAKHGYQDALPQTCLVGLCDKHDLSVRSGHLASAPGLALTPADPPTIIVDDSLVVSATTEVETSAPLAGRARRTNFSFFRDGLRVNDCWLYEPAVGIGPFPTLLLVLPGPVMGWEIIPVPFAGKGYSVLACYPLRGLEIDDDAADLLTALEYLRQGRLPAHANTERLGLIAASFTSLHGYRLLELSSDFDVALILGGLADGFRFRHDVETGAAQARAPFDQALLALGLPNTSPELYFRYSVVFHTEGLPPLCLLHGRDDELVPYSQGTLLDEVLTERGLPHRFYSYDGLSHYFSTSADNATTQQMFIDSLDCLAESLAAN
jgi:hypothetical protein